MVGKQPKRKLRPGVDEYGRTPLHYAAASGDAAQVQHLIREGANVDAQDDNGWTPLHFAAQADSAVVTSELIGAGANVALRDSFGNAPLSKAVFSSQGDGSVIRALRTAGADPHAKNKHGVTPVQLARKIANFDVAQFFSDVP
jgi:ankyrin repeat protein